MARTSKANNVETIPDAVPVETAPEEATAAADASIDALAVEPVEPIPAKQSTSRAPKAAPVAAPVSNPDSAPVAAPLMAPVLSAPAGSRVFSVPVPVYANPSAKLHVYDIVGAANVIKSGISAPDGSTYSFVRYKLPGSGVVATGYIRDTDSEAPGGNDPEIPAPEPENPEQP